MAEEKEEKTSEEKVSEARTERTNLGDGIARQELNVLFVIDNSGSMAGEKIGAVNNAIRDVMSIMPEIQEDTSDAVIKLSALRFSDSAEWLYSEPKSIADFKWKDLSAMGGTNLSAAYDALASWLRKREHGGQMPDFGGIAPIILLMTDGIPTSRDWEEHLEKLRKCAWFRVALKYALAVQIDTEEAMSVLCRFTGDPATVLKVYTAEALRKVIQVIAVTASQVKSNSASVSAAVTGQTVDNNTLAQSEIAAQLEEVEDVEW